MSKRAKSKAPRELWICWRADLHRSRSVELDSDNEAHRRRDSEAESRLSELDKIRGRTLANELKSRYYEWKTKEPDSGLIEREYIEGQVLSGAEELEFESTWHPAYRDRTAEFFCPLFPLNGVMVWDPSGVRNGRPWKGRGELNAKRPRMDSKTYDEFKLACAELRSAGVRTNIQIAAALYYSKRWESFRIYEMKVARALKDFDDSQAAADALGRP